MVYTEMQGSYEGGSQGTLEEGMYPTAKWPQNGVFLDEE